MQDEIFSPASIPGKLSLDRCTFLLYSPRLSIWSADNAEYRENEKTGRKNGNFNRKRFEKGA